MYEFVQCYVPIAIECTEAVDIRFLKRRMVISKAIMQFNLSEPLFDNPASKRSVGQKRRWHVWRALKKFDTDQQFSHDL